MVYHTTIEPRKVLFELLTWKVVTQLIRTVKTMELRNKLFPTDKGGVGVIGLTQFNNTASSVHYGASEPLLYAVQITRRRSIS